MTHDPLCPRWVEPIGGASGCPHCALIALIREDEQWQASLAVTNAWNVGYLYGLSAAREAVAANRLNGLVTEGWEHTINETIDEALAAIDALRGEPKDPNESADSYQWRDA